MLLFLWVYNKETNVKIIAICLQKGKDTDVASWINGKCFIFWVGRCIKTFQGKRLTRLDLSKTEKQRERNHNQEKNMLSYSVQLGPKIQ